MAKGWIFGGASQTVPEYNTFISYPSSYRDFVARIVRELRKRKVRTFFDQDRIEPGSEAIPRLESAIGDCESFVMCVGEESGKWSAWELATAMTLKKPIFTVMLPRCADEEMRRIPEAATQRSFFDFRSGLTVGGLNKLAATLGGVEEAPAAPRHPIYPASDLANHFRKENATFFLGASAVDGRDLATYLQIARTLAGELHADGESFDFCFLAELAELVSRAPIARRWPELSQGLFDVVPQVYEQVANLMKILQGRTLTSRIPPKTPLLIVTTNVDLSLEKALLLQGVPFTRIVQRITPMAVVDRPDWLVVNQFPIVSCEDDAVRLPVAEDLPRDEPQALWHGEGRSRRWLTIDPADENSLEFLIKTYNRKEITWTQRQNGVAQAQEGLLISKLPQPIVYKFLGSLDIEGSTVLTRSRQFEYQRSLLELGCIPDQITEIIHQSPMVFIGHSAINPDYHLVRNTLLRRMTPDQANRYLIHECPRIFDRMGDDAERLWRGLKTITQTMHGLEWIETNPVAFLDALLEEVERPN